MNCGGFFPILSSEWFLAEILSIHSPEAGTDFCLRNVAKNLDMEENNPNKKLHLEVCFKWKKDGGIFTKGWGTKSWGTFFGGQKSTPPSNSEVGIPIQDCSTGPWRIVLCLPWLPRTGLGFFWREGASSQTRWWLQIFFHPYLEKMNPFRLIFFGWVESWNHQLANWILMFCCASLLSWLNVSEWHKNARNGGIPVYPPDDLETRMRCVGNHYKNTILDDNETNIAPENRLS